MACGGQVTPIGDRNVKSLLQPVLQEMGEELLARRDCRAIDERSRLLMPVMKKFTEDARFFEDILSRAQITGGRHLVPGTSQYVQHMIAKVNYRHNLDQTKCSQAQLWRYQVLDLMQKTIELQQSNIYTIRKSFWPSCVCDTNGDRVYQVLGLMWQSDFVVGVVEEVYRGAICKKKGEDPRRPPPCPTTFQYFHIACFMDAGVSWVWLIWDVVRMCACTAWGRFRICQHLPTPSNIFQWPPTSSRQNGHSGRSPSSVFSKRPF